MVWYDMIWNDMIWYDMIWYDMIWTNIIEYHFVKYVYICIQEFLNAFATRLLVPWILCWSIFKVTLEYIWFIWLTIFQITFLSFTWIGLPSRDMSQEMWMWWRHRNQPVLRHKHNMWARHMRDIPRSYMRTHT